MATGPQKAPDYAIHRSAVTSVDTIANVKETSAINCAQYQYAHIQVIPSGGANPNVAVYWWCEATSKFIQEHTAITKAGVGVNTPFEFTVNCRGRKMFVAITAIAAGPCDVYVSGFELED